jgi:lipopolysaccharide export system protein LptA
MATSIPKLPLLVALLAAQALTGEIRAAQVHSTQEAIDFSAAPVDIDIKNRIVIAHKVKITQGNLTLTADQGQVNGTGLQTAFDDSRWVFHGAVKVTMDTGVLNSDDAQVTFANKRLTYAVATGKPATFQQKIEKSDKTAVGHSESITYDVSKGIVHLTKNAWLSDGQNEVRGESLKYNMIAQTIAADASEQNNQRVHIIITPPPKPATSPTP